MDMSERYVSELIFVSFFCRRSSSARSNSNNEATTSSHSGTFWHNFVQWVFSDQFHHLYPFQIKVEKKLKGSLDSIPSPSPSVKIQIMSRKVCLRFIGKTLLGVVNKLFVFKNRQCFAFTHQTNFPTHNLNFQWRWRWWDWSQATF